MKHELRIRILLSKGVTVGSNRYDEVLVEAESLAEALDVFRDEFPDVPEENVSCVEWGLHGASKRLVITKTQSAANASELREALRRSGKKPF